MTEQEHGSVAMGDSREAEIRNAGLKARDELLERLADGGTVDNDLADYMSRIVEECVRAALSYCPAQEPPAPPADWKLVPIDPNPEMLGAWYRYKNGHHWPDEPPPRDTSDYGAYRAMLSAAPQPAHGTSATERATPAPAENLVGWQPIDTAPTDGREVRGITFDAQSPAAVVTKFVDGKWLTESKGEKFVAPGWNRWWPTHWQPIGDPAPQTNFVGQHFINIVDHKTYVVTSEVAGIVHYEREDLTSRHAPRYLGREEFDRRFQPSPQTTPNVDVEPDTASDIRAALATPTPKEESK